MSHLNAKNAKTLMISLTYHSWCTQIREWVEKVDMSIWNLYQVYYFFLSSLQLYWVSSTHHVWCLLSNYFFYFPFFQNISNISSLCSYHICHYILFFDLIIFIAVFNFWTYMNQNRQVLIVLKVPNYSMYILQTTVFIGFFHICICFI